MADPVPPPVVPPPGPLLPWWVVPTLSYLILLIFAGALVASCVMGNDTLRTQMFSATVALATVAVSFYFGSSKGSQDKDATIAAQGASLATSIPTTADDNPVLNPGSPLTPKPTPIATPAPSPPALNQSPIGGVPNERQE
jgi:hypothetical protein